MNILVHDSDIHVYPFLLSIQLEMELLTYRECKSSMLADSVKHSCLPTQLSQSFKFQPSLPLYFSKYCFITLPFLSFLSSFPHSIYIYLIFYFVFVPFVLQDLFWLLSSDLCFISVILFGCAFSAVHLAVEFLMSLFIFTLEFSLGSLISQFLIFCQISQLCVLLS